MKTLQITFEVETDIAAASMKAVLTHLIQAGDASPMYLAYMLRQGGGDVAEINENTVTVSEPAQ